MDYIPAVAAFSRHVAVFGGRCRDYNPSTHPDTLMPASDRRTFFARIGTASFSALMGAWWLAIKIVDWIGRLDVKDLLAALLKQAPEWAHDLLTTSPWFPGLACLGPAVFLIFVNWPRRSPTVAATPTSGAASGARSAPAASRGPLEDMMIADSHNRRPAEFRGRFSRSGTDATFYLDYSAFYPGVMGHNGWTERRKVEVFHQERYSNGVTINLPIVARRETANSVNWAMG